MEVIATAKPTHTHRMMLSGFIGYVGEGRGQGAAPRRTGPSHFAGRGLLQAESTRLGCSRAALELQPRRA